MSARLAAVIAAAFVLSGCVAVPPPGPSESEIAAVQQNALVQTWARTGLPGSPPLVEPGPALDIDAWGQAVFECVTRQGFELQSFEWSTDDGAALIADSGGAVDDPAMQRAFYECIAANPREFDERDMVLTDAQLDYIYDYYLKSLVPCMVLNGFTPSTAPTRVEFLAIAGQWSPYYSVDVGISTVQYEQLEQTCGPERPQLY
jgi:hypothetical protein